MSKVRGVRFTDKEERSIEEFLRKNPFLDFSTLAKVAILEFIKSPKLILNPVAASKKREAKNVRAV